MGKLCLYISGLTLSYTIFIMGKILYQKNEKLNIRIILTIIIFGIIIGSINLINPNMLDNILKIIILFSCIIIYYKFVFNMKLSELIIGSFITYLIFFISEAIVGLISVGIMMLISQEGMQLIIKSLIVNIAIAVLAIEVTCTQKGKLVMLIKEVNADKKILIVISGVILITLSILIFKTPNTEVKADLNFLISLILLILFCMIGFILLKQRRDVNKVTEEYKKLSEYSRITEGVLEQYRVNLHESKNQLIVIKNMIPKKNKELQQYVGNLVKTTKENKYYWINELKYIPIPELKGFINFKLMEMSNEGIKVEVNVDRDLDATNIKDIKVKDKGDFYSIIGVFLDNAREAALESKEKEVAIQVYADDKELHIIIANTYKGKVNLEKINEYGYSSKGQNRGTGLHIVNKIISKNPLFENKTELMDNYFMQHLILHIHAKK